MKEEIEAAALFLTQLVSQSSQLVNISEDRLQTFKRHLVRLFEERFHDHWFPERPQRGQGFRCIRLNGSSRPDPLIQKAAFETGLDYCDLKLPVEFTMWVDPREVSCRFGEHEGSYCTVASFGKETGAKAIADSALRPLQVVTDSDRSLAVPQQHSPRRNTSHRSRVSPSPLSPPRVVQQQQQQQQYRLNCFYPNYEPSHKGWYPVTATSSYSSLSPPPPPMALSYHAPKSRYVQQQHPWGLAYVPTVRYLNNWPMGQMVKVWGRKNLQKKKGSSFKKGQHTKRKFQSPVNPCLWSVIPFFFFSNYYLLQYFNLVCDKFLFFLSSRFSFFFSILKGVCFFRPTSLSSHSLCLFSFFFFFSFLAIYLACPPSTSHWRLHLSVQSVLPLSDSTYEKAH